jgi:hypothetical protein
MRFNACVELSTVVGTTGRLFLLLAFLCSGDLVSASRAASASDASAMACLDFCCYYRHLAVGGRSCVFNGKPAFAGSHARIQPGQSCSPSLADILSESTVVFGEIACGNVDRNRWKSRWLALSKTRCVSRTTTWGELRGLGDPDEFETIVLIPRCSNRTCQRAGRATARL